MTLTAASNRRFWAAVAAGALVLVPLLAYWQTIFADYGFRDDYAHLREVHEEPGKLVLFTAAHGRPLYGLLLDASIAPLHYVTDLPWLRLLGGGLIVAAAVLLWREMRRFGWSNAEAAAAGIAIALLPAAQITVGWAISWPNALSLLLGVAGFALVDRALAASGGRRAARMAAGCACYFAAGLTYPSNALFAVVPLAAAMLLRGADERLGTWRWAGAHVAALFGSVGLGFAIMKALFAAGVIFPAGRVRFETDPFGKLLWFVQEAVPNALALYVLRDRFGFGVPLFVAAAAAVAAAIGIGAWIAVRRRLVGRLELAFCLLAAPILGHAVSLAAGDRAVGYRTTFAVAGLVVVLAVFALRNLRLAGYLKPAAAVGVLSVAVLAAAFAAHGNAYDLIAAPQGREWRMVRDFVARWPAHAGLKAYLIRPRLEHRSTERVFADEFGSLSTDSDWVPLEMVRTALRERYGGAAPPYTLKFGYEEPAHGAYDVVLDMRTLGTLRGAPVSGG